MFSKAFLLDASERVAATVIVTALGSLTAWLLAGAPQGKVAMIALALPVVTGLWDVAKVVFARFIGNPDSASLNP